MEWKVLSKSDAALQTTEWQQMDEETFASMVKNWTEHLDSTIPDEYKELRTIVVKAYNDTKKEINNREEYKKKKDYFTDLIFALRFYEIMKSYDFSIRMASNDQVWMYLCVKIFPDVVHDRYTGVKLKTENGIISKNVNEERYWKTRRRIYLKVLWWYIYLSLQCTKDGKEDMKATFDVLKGNSTDEIVQIVERSGVAGYRVDVYREIMRFYSENRNRCDNTTFRRVMVLNTAKTCIVEPDLIDGGVKSYVKELFEFVGQ